MYWERQVGHICADVTSWRMMSWATIATNPSRSVCCNCEGFVIQDFLEQCVWCFVINDHHVFHCEIKWRLSSETQVKHVSLFLCVSSEVIGVAELVNKTNGPWFNRFDEDLATAFSIYCGISIAHVREIHSWRSVHHHMSWSYTDATHDATRFYFITSYGFGHYGQCEQLIFFTAVS